MQTREVNMTYQSTTPQGADKVMRYNWNMQDQPGTLANINKHEINFDKDYQRNQNKNKILAMAKDWSWLAMGVITLADRNGKFYAVDGMHRVSAALLRSDISELPCIIFKTSNVADEAKGFVQANTLRKAVSTADKHRALVLAGDEIAILVQNLLDDGGFVPAASGSTQNGVKCYGVLHKLAQNKRDALLKAWPLICDICQDRFLNEAIVQALVLIAERGTEDITSAKWSKAIKRVGFDGLKNAAKSAAAYYAKGGSKVWADGILIAINKGRRSRLEIANDNS